MALYLQALDGDGHWPRFSSRSWAPLWTSVCRRGGVNVLRRDFPDLHDFLHLRDRDLFRLTHRRIKVPRRLPTNITTAVESWFRINVLFICPPYLKFFLNIYGTNNQIKLDTWLEDNYRYFGKPLYWLLWGQKLTTFSTVNLFPASLKLGITVHLNLLCNVLTSYVDNNNTVCRWWSVFVLDKEVPCFLKNMLCYWLLLAK